MTERKSSRRSFLGYAVTAIVVGVVAGVGGYYAGLLSAPPGPGVTTTVTGPERTATVTTTTTAGPGVPVTTTITAPPTTRTITTTVTEKPTPSWERWIEGAKSEGKLVFYMMHRVELLDKLVASIKAEFPFLAVEYWRGPGAAVYSKVETEAKAGQVMADAIQIAGGRTFALIEAGLIEQYESPERAHYPEWALGEKGYEDNYYTGASINPASIVYNTKLVPPDKVPKTYIDLLDPYWKGKMGMQDPRVGATQSWFINMALGVYGPEYAEDNHEGYMRGIAAQEPVIMSSPTPLVDMMARGEIYLMPVYFPYNVEVMKKEGAPLEWVRIPLLEFGTQDLMILKGAPHPNTARLFVDWLLSEKGQQAFADAGAIPARPGVIPENPDLVKDLVPEEAKMEQYVNNEKWANLAAEYFNIKG